MYQKRAINISTLFFCILISVAKTSYAQSANSTSIYKAALKYFRTDTALSNNVKISFKKLRFAVHPLTIKTGYQNTLNDKEIFSAKADSIEKSLAALDGKFNKDFEPQKTHLSDRMSKADYTVFFSAVQDNMLYAELRYSTKSDPNYSMGTVFCYRMYLKHGEISKVITGKLYAE